MDVELRLLHGSQLIISSVFPLNDRQRRVINCLLNGFTAKRTSSQYAILAQCPHGAAAHDLEDLSRRLSVTRRQLHGSSSDAYPADLEPE